MCFITCRRKLIDRRSMAKTDQFAVFRALEGPAIFLWRCQLGHSKVYAVNREKFVEIVKESNSKIEILVKLGLRAAGGNFKTLTRRLIAEDLLDGLKLRTTKLVKDILTKSRRSLPLDEVMIENSNYSRQNLKQRLLKLGKLQNRCSVCGIGPEWYGKQLTLQLDHINGLYNDNRLENLRIICPNCHSQTDTYVGKANRTGIKKSLGKMRNICIMCQQPAAIGSKSGLCRKCYDLRRRKVQRPHREELQSIIKEIGFRATGRKYNVSDNAVRKWLK